jgi:hypothetical protein
MQVGFICPNGEKIRHEECLTKCRQPIQVNGFNVRRCGTLSQMSAMAQVRQWKGKPSTTQLILPTRIAYLRLTQDYFVSPEDLVFMFTGTKGHKKLEGADTKHSILEQFLEDEEMTGLSDNYEVEDGIHVLSDYKFWGSYAAARALGIVMVGKKPDPEGEVYKTSGYWGKAGTPKMIPIWGFNPDMADLKDEKLQLNRYRLFWQDATFPVDVLLLRIYIRDGGLEVAEKRGITNKLYTIPIKKLPDDEIRDYFHAKREKLLTALEKQGLPPICDKEERWDGRRCTRFCEVRDFCPDYNTWQLSPHYTYIR